MTHSPRMVSLRMLVTAVSWTALLGAPHAGAQTPSTAPAVDETGLQDRLDRLADELDAQRRQLDLPGLSVAVVVGDTVVMARGFGQRDIALDLPATADTVYAVGSTTKAFTATLAAMLVDDGAMTWDDPVRRHLPSVAFRDVVLNERITMRDLLSHRSGFMGMDMLWFAGESTWDDMVPCIGRAVPTADVGERFQYNNVMYLVAGRAVAAAADSTWEELIEARLFRPLGMARSSTSLEALGGEVHTATGYRRGADGAWTAIERRPLQNVAPAGAINSNVLDMARWIRFQLRRGQQGGEQLVEAPQLEETWRGQIDVTPGVAYGLGWMTTEWNGRRLIEHSGGIDGFSAHVAFLPDDDIGCVLLANATATSFPVLARSIVFDHLLGGDTAAADATEWAPFLGTYRFDVLNADVTVLERDGALAIDVPGQMVYQLNPPDEQGRRTFRGFEAIAIAFDPVVDGSVAGLSLFQSGEVFRLPRRGAEPPPVELDAAMIQAMRAAVGRYAFEAIDTEFEVRMESDRLAVDVPGQRLYPLDAPDADGWWPFAMVPSIAVRFERDEQGAVDAMTFRQAGRENRLPRLGAEGGAPLLSAPDVMEFVHLSRGSPAYHQVFNLHMKGTVRFENQGVEGAVQLLVAGFDRYLMRMEFPPFGWVQTGWISWLGWSDSAFAGYRELEGVAFEQLKLQHPMLLLTDWPNFFSDVQTLRVDRLDGDDVYVLRATPRDGAAPQTLFIRARDGFLLRSEGAHEVAGGASIPVTAVFEDYRRVSGVAMPFRVITEDAVNGRVVVQLDAVIPNVELKEEPWFMNEQDRAYPTLSDWWVVE